MIALDKITSKDLLAFEPFISPCGYCVGIAPVKEIPF